MKKKNIYAINDDDGDGDDDALDQIDNKAHY